MTKTFLYGHVVAIQPARGGAFIHIELNPATKPVTTFAAGRERSGVVAKQPETRRLKLVLNVWQRLKRERAADEILTRRVILDQEPLRFAFIDARGVYEDVEGWYPAWEPKP